MAADKEPGQDQFRRAGPFMLSANKHTAIAGLKLTKVSGLWDNILVSKENS